MKFNKVTLNQFRIDCKKYCDVESDEQIVRCYEEIKMPKRATIGSAGYDFFMPFSRCVKPGENLIIPTGICVQIPSDVALFIFPRSGLGVKHHLQLTNTVGIIDSDYYLAKNQGHILIAIHYPMTQENSLQLNQGIGFAQGVFLPYYIVDDENVEEVRQGGFGSTD